MSQDTKAIITNKEMIAVNQDSLGVQAWHYSSDQGLSFGSNLLPTEIGR